MKIFVAASYSAEVNYDTGEVNPEYKHWLEDNLIKLEGYGHEVFCSLRADQYRINNEDPAQAFRLDLDEITKADGLLAFVTRSASAGVQTEIGIAVAQNKQVVIAHLPDDKLAYFNNAIINAGNAKERLLPLESDPFL